MVFIETTDYIAPQRLLQLQTSSHLITSLVYVRASLIPYKGFHKNQLDKNISRNLTAFDKNNRNLLSRHAKNNKKKQKDMDKENLEIKHVCIYVYNMIIGKPVTLWANSDR